MAKRGNGLWIAAGIATIVVVAAVLVDPSDFGDTPEQSEVENLLEKASTYYEFEHYDRAAETYRQAAEIGMSDGLDWYQYAHSLLESEQEYIESYVNAYRLLLEQAPYHDYLAETQRVLASRAIQFDYTAAKAGEIPEGSLIVATGGVGRVRRGRSASGVDTLFVDTQPHDWFGYLGESVRIVAPKSRSFQTGDTVSAIGWFDGWCEVDDDAGLLVLYPCINAAGVVTAR